MTLDDEQVRSEKAVGDGVRARSASRGVCPVCSKIVLGNQDRVKIMPPKDKVSVLIQLIDPPSLYVSVGCNSCKLAQKPEGVAQLIHSMAYDSFRRQS